jgi:hypothetical protein
MIALAAWDERPDIDQLDERRRDIALHPIEEDFPVLVSGAIPHRRFRGSSLGWPR